MNAYREILPISFETAFTENLSICIDKVKATFLIIIILSCEDSVYKLSILRLIL